MKLDFESTHFLTLGVELEFQVLDNNTLQLAPRAHDIIDRANDKKITHEFFQSTLEVITGICKNAGEVSNDLNQTMSKARGAAAASGLELASTGTHPQADYRDRLVTDSPRYGELIDRNQWLIRRMAVYGMHIHIGMRTGDECIRYNNFFLHFVPHLIALSASSPFWQKMDTGLASCRPTTYESLPTAGMPYIVKDWHDYEKLIHFLKRSDAIHSLKDLWWDLRPSPGNGTLEIRICDGPATHTEMLGIVAFAHALAHWYHDHQEDWTKSHAPIKRWIFRENKWRAIRYGLDASIIVSRAGRTVGLRNDIENWIVALAPYFHRLGYQRYVEVIPLLLRHGNSAQRQRRVFQESKDLLAVTQHNIREFTENTIHWS